MLPEVIAALKATKWRREETHIDDVLIGPRFAYKIKKPVKFSFVDYSTLAKRKHFCQEEVRLNRRYAPSIYLGVVPIRHQGEIIEYAVKMKALPHRRRVDQLLARRQLTPAMIDKIAAMIANFHRRARPARPRRLKKIIRQNFQLIQARPLEHYLLGFLKNHNPFHNVRDLHGDLHTENIYYDQRPYLLDCVEFNADFRFIDTAAEISYLLMDLEFRGAPALARRFLQSYLKQTKDFGVLPLLNFYKCHYASVRGMVNTLEKRPGIARRYLRLAKKYARAKPLILAVSGLIGTGKSTLAKNLAATLGYKLIRSDELRKHLPGRPDYSLAGRLRVYRALFLRANKLLQKGENVILDASFSRKVFRAGLKSLSGGRLVLIETSLSKTAILKRLLARRRGLSDARARDFRSFVANFELIKELPNLTVKTSTHPKKTMTSALFQLLPYF